MDEKQEHCLVVFKEEGDICNEDGCNGVIVYTKSENCSCHINSPCSSCMEVYLYCPECGWEE